MQNPFPGNRMLRRSLVQIRQDSGIVGDVAPVIIRTKAGINPEYVDSAILARRIRSATAEVTVAGSPAADRRLSLKLERQELYRQHMAETKAICEEMALEVGD